MDYIYDDLDVNINLDIEYHKVLDLNKEFSKKIGVLETEVTRLQDLIVLMKKQQSDLENNISSLYNTARAECERKDRQIEELRKKLDDLIHRRGGSRHTSHTSRSASPAPKKRSNSKSDWEKQRSPRRQHDSCDLVDNYKNTAGGGRAAHYRSSERYRDGRQYLPDKLRLKRKMEYDRRSPANKRTRYYDRNDGIKDRQENMLRKRYDDKFDKVDNWNKKDVEGKEENKKFINHEINNKINIKQFDLEKEEGEIGDSPIKTNFTITTRNHPVRKVPNREIGLEKQLKKDQTEIGLEPIKKPSANKKHATDVQPETNFQVDTKECRLSNVVNNERLATQLATAQQTSFKNCFSNKSYPKTTFAHTKPPMIPVNVLFSNSPLNLSATEAPPPIFTNSAKVNIPMAKVDLPKDVCLGLNTSLPERQDHTTQDRKTRNVEMITLPDEPIDVCVSNVELTNVPNAIKNDQKAVQDTEIKTSEDIPVVNNPLIPVGSVTRGKPRPKRRGVVVHMVD